LSFVPLRPIAYYATVIRPLISSDLTPLNKYACRVRALAYTVDQLDGQPTVLHQLTALQTPLFPRLRTLLWTELYHLSVPEAIPMLYPSVKHLNISFRMENLSDSGSIPVDFVSRIPNLRSLRLSGVKLPACFSASTKTGEFGNCGRLGRDDLILEPRIFDTSWSIGTGFSTQALNP
jgi:hypothetical protein